MLSQLGRKLCKIGGVSKREKKKKKKKEEEEEVGEYGVSVGSRMNACSTYLLIGIS